VVMTRVRLRSQPSYLERLAVVFADPIRLTIVTELFARPMSPSQFFGEFGGGSLGRVDRHFKRLADSGWLRLVKQATGGKRRGATENFYRATELATIDTETWSSIPRSLREEYSCRVFEQFCERVGDALVAETFDSDPKRHFTWTPLILDEEARQDVIASVDRLFKSALEEQADAKFRLPKSNEDPRIVTVGLAAFDSPGDVSLPPRLPASRNPSPASSPLTFTARLARVFADPVSLTIVTELNLREMSAKEFAEKHGDQTLPNVARRFKSLTELGWLVKVGEKTGGKRRGSKESFYRATGPATFDTETWSNIPAAVRATKSWQVLTQLSEQARRAMTAGTFDARTDRHLTWVPIVLDTQGWTQLIAAADAVFHNLFKAQAAAKRRLTVSGETPQILTVSLAVFESPPKSVDILF